MPERELHNSENFIEKFYKHLNDETAAMLLVNGEKCEGKELLETYKYIFNSPIDWTGPLNYFRNLLFYRVKANISIRCVANNSIFFFYYLNFPFSCPCIIISGNEDPNYKLETIIKCGEFCENSLIRIIEGAGHFPHQSHSDDVNKILVKILGGPIKKPEIQDESLTGQRGIVGRMINKMYGVGQHYGSLSVNGTIFSGLT